MTETDLGERLIEHGDEQELGDDPRAQRVAARLELPMLVAAALVIPTVVIEESHAGGDWPVIGLTLDWIVWLAFASELVIMLAVARSRRRWIASHPLELGIVLLTPPFMPVLLQGLRAVRLLRLFRLLRLARLVRVASLSRAAFSLNGLRWAAVLTGCTVLGSGAAFAEVEHESHLSTWDGVWWAITTMTTVGYGDVAPRTVAGRLIAIVVMLVGIGFVALLTAAVAQRFLASDDGPRGFERQVLARLDALNDRLDRLEQGLPERTRTGAGDPGTTPP
jgi:voltage-gated potassium channel